jgi:hypothetical protein
MTALILAGTARPIRIGWVAVPGRPQPDFPSPEHPAAPGRR